MPDLGEFVDAYDTRTGEKQTVPVAWLEQNLYSHLSKTPPKKGATPAKPVPAKSASKPDWVIYATKDAPADKRLSVEAAEAMTVEAMHDYYTQEG